MQMRATLATDDITVVYTATAERTDYGVPRSPTFLEIDPSSIEIESFELLGHDFPLKEIPAWLEEILHEQTDDLDWERDE